MPKLEGTVHVNMALIIKFILNYFFGHAEYPEIPKRNDPKNDDFLFNQGLTKGLSKIRFHDYNPVYDSVDLPNVNLFKEQIEAFKEFVIGSAPGAAEKAKEIDFTKIDFDFLLAVGELFTLVPYGQLILENAKIYNVDKDIIDQIFDFIIRDFSKFAMKLYSKTDTTPKQMDICMKMIRKPVVDKERYERVLNNYVYALKDTYEMNE